MTETGQEVSPAAKWVSYRPDIKLLDCTIRDGGLMNSHLFDDTTVKSVYTACVEGGIDYMEIGYINSKRLFPVFRHLEQCLANKHNIPAYSGKFLRHD